MSHIEFQNHYGLKIPMSWKREISIYNNKINSQNMNPNMQKFVKKDKICRKIYQVFIDNLKVKNNNEIKWEHNITSTIASHEWKIIYSNIYFSTTETKLRRFQFNIIQRVLPTNYFLFKCQIIDSDKCTFCQNYPETMEHLFFECELVMQLWREMANWFHPYISLGHLITDKNILLGQNLDVNSRLINHIIIITKYYIYVQRCCKINLSLIGVLKYIRKYYDLEKYSLNVFKFKKDIYEAKWLPIVEIINNV